MSHIKKLEKFVIDLMGWDFNIPIICLILFRYLKRIGINCEEKICFGWINTCDPIGRSIYDKGITPNPHPRCETEKKCLRSFQKKFR